MCETITPKIFRNLFDVHQLIVETACFFLHFFGWGLRGQSPKNRIVISQFSACYD